MEKNILIFRVGQFGDALVAIPAIKIIRERHVNDRLVLITDVHPGKDYVSSWDVYEATGWFDEVVFYEPGTGIQDTLSLARKLRALSPEYVYALAPERGRLRRLRDQAFFKILLGARHYRGQHLGFGVRQMPLNGLPRVEPEWLRLLKIAGADQHSGEIRLPVPAADAAAAREVLDIEGVALGGSFLVMGPGSKMPAKIWPLERYVELGKRLSQTFPALNLVVLGGKDAVSVGEALHRQVGGRLFNLAGKLPIYGSAEVLKHSVGYVGNDSGVMHLAGALGKPCVALFSARDNPGKWEPFGNEHVILRHDVECAGCMRMVCETNDNQCLKLITVDDAFEAVAIILARAG